MLNPFAFFGLEPSLNINSKALRKQFLEIQRGAHPDLQNSSLANSNFLSEQANAHYKVLINRESLVKAFIECKGFSGLHVNQLSKDYLLEMMDLSDEIESMNRNNAVSIAAVESAIKKHESNLLENFSELCDSFDAIQPQLLKEIDIESLVVWYQKHKYLSRLRKNFEGIDEL